MSRFLGAQLHTTYKWSRLIRSCTYRLPIFHIMTVWLATVYRRLSNRFDNILKKRSYFQLGNENKQRNDVDVIQKSNYEAWRKKKNRWFHRKIAVVWDDRKEIVDKVFFFSSTRRLYKDCSGLSNRVRKITRTVLKL